MRGGDRSGKGGQLGWCQGGPGSCFRLLLQKERESRTFLGESLQLFCKYESLKWGEDQATASNFLKPQGSFIPQYLRVEMVFFFF